MHIADVLEDIRSSALSEPEKGHRFETLIRAWLLADPVYGVELSDVWLWENFPAKAQFGGHDLGIDLVARTRLGEYWAIQCKFYGENTSIDKAAVDSFISNSSRTFIDPYSHEKTGFSARYWISTNDYFNANALQSILNQTIPVQRLTLEHLAQSAVDWDALYKGKQQRKTRKKPLPHQEEAVKKAHKHFATQVRGKLIMACGTGKSFTANLIAQNEVPENGAILCLVPSISLVNQFLNSWMSDTEIPTHAICICSDAKASRKKGDDQTDSVTDLALPATTNAREIARRYLAYQKLINKEGKGHIVVFSTYQSIDAVADAQRQISKNLGHEHRFDLIICDEAHRTTGLVKPQEGKTPFTKIHDDSFIHGKKRLYMTATPRIYADNAKIKAKESDIELCSMDDEKLYGGEIHNVSFGYAVDNGLLTDYKVLVLTVGSEYQIPDELRREIQNPEKKELNFDITSKLVGCINGLAKNTTLPDNAIVWEADPRIMKRAIAFCPNIDKKGDPASSKNTAAILPEIARSLFAPSDHPEHQISIEARHIDGSMDSATRANHLAWLTQGSPSEDKCRVLCNVRCLSEGIDVPALDAAIFLSPRNSQVDVVQSVGRIMRNFRRGHADEKKYGYIIIPVVINPRVSPEEALNDNEAFSVVWSILNALRSHDDRFEAMINSLALNNEKPKKIITDKTKFYPGSGYDETPPTDNEGQAFPAITQAELFENLEKQIYGKMVEKVGSRLYWERWARNIAPLAQNLIGRIGELVAMPGEVRESFAAFVKALQAAINDSIDEKQAIEMLGQHMITRPVFEALFADYAFEENNAVTRAMKNMVDKLLAHGLEKDTAILKEFYESVKRNLGEVKTLSGKQTVIKNLYDSFFKGAFPLAVEQLGIVYTPIECVDFILRSVDGALRQEFGLGLTDEGVHILDPFTGTGTFITRLLQSGLIKREDLERKYREEIHCNEIMLLAYYVADVNIESVYHDISGSKEYQRFNGICLTDTFALSDMAKQPELFPFLKANFESIEAEDKAPIRVIIGNPPYSIGQRAANDNAQNIKYTELDKRIEETYVAKSLANRKSALYDSYIRAFRWATDRLHRNNEGGVIGFITNGGWLDGNAAAGFRKCLEKEFSSIYVFHLRGDQRTSGELSRKEGGKIFGQGSRAPVVITILVYNPTHKGKAQIHYSDIGDYLNREQKLNIIAGRSSVLDPAMNWQDITPDEHGDWLKQRSDIFGSFIVIGDKKDKGNRETFFEPVYSLGVATNRDAWCWNFSKNELENNIKRSIEFYNKQCEEVRNGKEIKYDSTQFSWDRQQKKDVLKDKKYNYLKNNLRLGIYRPFTEENLYFSRSLNNCVYQIPQIFTSAIADNKIICVNGLGGTKEFSCVMINRIPDLNMLNAGTQSFPLYYYQEKRNRQANLLENKQEYQRKDGITDWILKNIRGRFGNARNITKETIFYYVYGLLHSRDYRNRFNDDLKKELPHIPIVERVEDFIDFAQAGKKLADLHVGYEAVPPCPDVLVSGAEKGNFHVEKMKFAGRQGAWDKSTIIYNPDIAISHIPLRAYEYVVNGRSAIEWIMESYRIKVDKASGIKNDPNAWAAEHGKPRYILDLLLSVINLSLQTLDIVDGLPRLEF